MLPVRPHRRRCPLPANCEFCEARGVAVRLAIALAALFVKDDDFLAANVTDDGGRQCGCRAKGHSAIISLRDQRFAEIDLLARFRIGHVGHPERLRRAVYLKLFSGNLYNCEHFEESMKYEV